MSAFYSNNDNKINNKHNKDDGGMVILPLNQY